MYASPMPMAVATPMAVPTPVAIPTPVAVPTPVAMPMVQSTVGMGVDQVIINKCPMCRHGYLKTRPTVCGILLAIFLFPIGILFLVLLLKVSCQICEYNKYKYSCC